MNGGVGMATSALDSMLLSSIKALSDNQAMQDNPEALPSYLDKEHYQDWLVKEKIRIQNNFSGYVVLKTDKEEYSTGEMIKGTVYIDLFQPTYQKDIFIKFKGVQEVPARYRGLVDDSAGDNDGFLLRRSLQRDYENQDVSVGFEKMDEVNALIPQSQRKESLRSNEKYRQSQHSYLSGRKLSLNSRDEAPDNGSLRPTSNESSRFHLPQIVGGGEKLRLRSTLTNQLVSKQDKIIQSNQPQDDQTQIDCIPYSPSNSEEKKLQQIDGLPSCMDEGNKDTIQYTPNHNQNTRLFSPSMLPGGDGQTFQQSQMEPNKIDFQKAEETAQDFQEDQQSMQAPFDQEEEQVDMCPPRTYQEAEREIEGGQFMIFKLDERLFKFRGDQTPRGQYMFPFTFQVPKDVPSSFKFSTAIGDFYCIKYTIEVYFNNPRPLMCESKEIRILAAENKPRRNQSSINKQNNTSIKSKDLSTNENSKHMQSSPPHFNIPGASSHDRSFEKIEETKHQPMYGELPFDNPKMLAKLRPMKNKAKKVNLNKVSALPYDYKPEGAGSDDEFCEERQWQKKLISIESFSCLGSLCGGTKIIETALFQKVFKPDQTVEVTVLLGKLFRKVRKIKVSLCMEMTIKSLMEPPVVIDTIFQELGSETLQVGDIKKHSDGENLLARLSLSKIQHRNRVIRDGYLRDAPKGVNLYRNKPEEKTIFDKIKKVPKAGMNRSGTAMKGILNDIVFEHSDPQDGTSWEQDYQFVEFASSNGDVIQTDLYIQVEIDVKNNFGLSTQVEKRLLPIKVLTPRASLQKCLDVTKEKNQDYNQVKSLLEYPELRRTPREFRPIMMPGSHFKLERTKKLVVNKKTQPIQRRTPVEHHNPQSQRPSKKRKLGRVGF